MTMLMVNIAEAKAKLSEYVEAVANGEHVIICNRNRPVAELRAIEAARSGRLAGKGRRDEARL
jgi:prevent-host-death family protein